MLGALSFSVVTPHFTAAVNAIQDHPSSHHNGKLAWLPFQLYPERAYYRSHMLRLFCRQKGTSTTQKSLVFAIPNEAGQFLKGSSHACCDENDPVMKVAYHRPSEQDHSKSSMHPGNQADILDKLKTIYLHLLASDQWNAASLRKCDRTYLVSATNLIHYLALKSLDVEQLKEDVLSTAMLCLDAITPYVIPGLTACIQTLESSLGNSENSEGKIEVTKFKSIDLSIGNMRKVVSNNEDRLLGPLQVGRTTHIMVTVGEEALASQSLVPDILMLGATVVRINCAHGNPSIWSDIIRTVRQSSQKLEKPCRVLMDLAGPKLRTDKLKESPRVLKISPRKNATGDLLSPAQVWLAYKGTDPPVHLSPDAVVYIDNEEFFSNLELDNLIFFRDARGKRRMLKISMKLSTCAGVMSECTKTAYVLSGTKLHIKGKGNKGKHHIGVAVDIPPAKQFVRVKAGDILIISRESSTEQEKSFAPTSGFHRITCSSSYLYDSVKPGESIAFDDGKIWGEIQGTSASEIIVSVTHAGVKGSKLGSEKSINIPDSCIRFEGLTSKDIMDLEFVASQADMVGVSFIRDVRDIVVLRKELQKLKAQNLGVVLKVETKEGFENLPLLLLEAMKSPNPLGVMIARGDLAVECGWERLADIQEQMLSICRAAHIPLIWATQVLESLVKSGMPTRAEITDVAAGRRASCIMLNKGKNIREAISMLGAILQSNSHTAKAVMRPSSHIRSPL